MVEKTKDVVGFHSQWLPLPEDLEPDPPSDPPTDPPSQAGGSRTRSERQFRDDEPVSSELIPNPNDATQNLVYIKDLSLMIDGIPINSLFDSNMDKFDCQMDYYRLNEVMGFDRSRNDNGITYDAFNK